MGWPEQQPQDELLLQGQLQDLELSTLLSALELGRQYFTLELFDAAGERTGSVSVKSGRILSASAGAQRGAAAVRHLLESHEASAFRVRLQPSDAEAEMEVEPVGTLSEIAQTLGATEAERLPDRTQILQGALTDSLTLDELLRVVAFTRQHVALELTGETNKTLGEVRLKAGKVLSARAGELNELPAVQELLRAPAGTHFALFTEADSVEQLRPLGSVADVLARANGRAPAPQSNGLRKTLPPPLPRGARSTGSPANASPRRARILEGNLDEFELSHVLKVLSTSRQQFELHVRDDAAASVGVIEVKSGIVIGASTDKSNGIAAARELLQARAGRFVAIRRAEASGDRTPLISVTELLKPPAANDDPEDAFEDTPTHNLIPALVVDGKKLSAPVPVLHGKLGDLDVASILHVAGASRQYTCVHVFDDQRKPLGVIHLKSGHVVRAQAQDVTGVAAVRRLLHSPRDFSYVVQRYPNAPEVTKSIGSIPNVLERAARTATQANKIAPARQSQTPPSQTTTASGLTPVSRRSGAQPNSSWMGGAVLGAGFVLLGGIAAAVVLRSPALNQTTTVSPISAPPPAADPAPPPAAAAHAEEPREPDPAKPAADSGNATAEAAAPSRASVASLQAGLRQLGYEPGPIDGVVGPRTSAAIKAFQYAEHLAVDGTLSAATRAVLLRRIGEP